MENILTVDNLTTSFKTHSGMVQAVRGVSFSVAKGETVGIVGESGSGKSVTSLSILRVLQDNGKIVEGKIDFKGQNLVEFSKSQMRTVRGRQISMIFQDPMSSLNPLMTVGAQISEAIIEHNKNLTRHQAMEKALELLTMVKIPDPQSRIKAYPHELSGGMRQRVMTAIALSCKPELIIADEPTTALDVTIQDQIIMLLKELQKEVNMSIMFITHDLGVVAELCDRVIVMYGGLIMEEGTTEELFYSPKHPYTLGLLSSIPKINQDKSERLRPILGSPPDMLDPPKGCPFAPRCEFARNICINERPNFYTISPTHKSMCWLLDEAAPKVKNPFVGEAIVKEGSVHA